MATLATDFAFAFGDDDEEEINAFSFVFGDEPEEKYARVAIQLLPPGVIWNTDRDATIKKVALAITDEFARIDARAQNLVEELDPRTAAETLPEWEQAVSLPDDQVPEIPATLPQRRVAVVQKLVGRTGQNYAFYARLCGACGYPLVSITKHAVDMTRSGTARSGDRLSGTAWAYAITITVSAATSGALTHAQFEAVIRHATHSHITVVFVYT